RSRCASRDTTRQRRGMEKRPRNRAAADGYDGTPAVDKIAGQLALIAGKDVDKEAAALKCDAIGFASSRRYWTTFQPVTLQMAEREVRDLIRPQEPKRNEKIVRVARHGAKRMR